MHHKVGVGVYEVIPYTRTICILGSRKKPGSGNVLSDVTTAEPVTNDEKSANLCTSRLVK